MESKKTFNLIAVICFLCTILVIFLGLSSFRIDAFAAMGDYLIINDGTPMYEDSTGEKEIKRLNKGEVLSEVEVVGDYYKAKVNETIGYIKKYDVEIKSIEDVSTSFFIGKAFSSKVGEKVKLYQEPSYDATVAFEINDGYKLVTSDQNNNGFYSVRYNNETLYVPTTNITKSLSANQRAALWATIVASATIILVFALLYAYKHFKDKKILEEFQQRREG